MTSRSFKLVSDAYRYCLRPRVLSNPRRRHRFRLLPNLSKIVLVMERFYRDALANAFPSVNLLAVFRLATKLALRAHNRYLHS